MIELSTSDNTVTLTLGNIPRTAAGLRNGYLLNKTLPEAPFEFEYQHPLNIPTGAHSTHTDNPNSPNRWLEHNFECIEKQPHN